MPSKNFQPALYGGLFIGILSALPIINLGNVCCCMWVIGGGVITAYLMQQASPVAITVGDGALGGLMAGVVGAVVDMVVSIPVNLLWGPMQAQMLRRVLESSPEVKDAMPQFFRPEGAAAAGIFLAAIVGLVFMLLIGVIFGTVGGMIGAAIFNRGKPAVVSAPPPPPPA